MCLVEMLRMAKSRKPSLRVVLQVLLDTVQQTQQGEDSEDDNVATLIMSVIAKSPSAMFGNVHSN